MYNYSNYNHNHDFNHHQQKKTMHHSIYNHSNFTLSHIVTIEQYKHKRQRKNKKQANTNNIKLKNIKTKKLSKNCIIDNTIHINSNYTFCLCCHRQPILFYSKKNEQRDHKQNYKVHFEKTKQKNITQTQQLGPQRTFHC